jgi:6-phosphogluconolactonase (cycloisomerase 2 family)
MGMLNRRHVTAMLGAAGALSGGNSRAAGTTIPFYASAGPKLTQYDLDVAAASLTPKTSITLPANVQYAWPHPTRRFLYVVASNTQPGSGPMGATGADKNHYALAFMVLPDGSLKPHGEPRLLPSRPLHVSTDYQGTFLFTAYNVPSRVTVHHLNVDYSIGEEMQQDPRLDFGIYAHQTRMTTNDRTLILCSRGNDAANGKPEDPGHIEVLACMTGRLANIQTIKPGAAGLGFGPRHLDFDPTGHFAYVSLERENSIAVFGVVAGGRLTPEPLFVKSALTDPDGKAKHPGQGVGPIHVHPKGGFVYQTNRGSGLKEVNGRKVSNGGENNVVVWAIDQATGEPTLIQRAWTDDYELRTFSIDPSGQVLIAASTTPMLVEEQGVFSTVSAGLTVYRIGADGKLAPGHKYEVDTSGGIQFWSGLLTMS